MSTIFGPILLRSSARAAGNFTEFFFEGGRVGRCSFNTVSESRLKYTRRKVSDFIKFLTTCMKD
jgi:hypothetical protein